jgi:hypothetical protein
VTCGLSCCVQSVWSQSGPMPTSSSGGQPWAIPAWRVNSVSSQPYRQHVASTSECVFCGRPWEPGKVRHSREHIWSQWLRDHAGELPAERWSARTRAADGFERPFIHRATLRIRAGQSISAEPGHQGGMPGLQRPTGPGPGAEGQASLLDGGSRRRTRFNSRTASRRCPHARALGTEDGDHTRADCVTAQSRHTADGPGDTRRRHQYGARRCGHPGIRRTTRC